MKLPKEFVSAVNSLNSLQSVDGAIHATVDTTPVEFLVRTVLHHAVNIAVSLGRFEYAKALGGDFELWIDSGFRAKPDFKRSRDVLKPPSDGEFFFFVGPLRLANGQREGWKFECFLAAREEPGSEEYNELYSQYPHPKNICQSTHLLYGSSGLTQGNNIVFFPENIQASELLTEQGYAVFFFNKFYSIFNEITVRKATESCSNIEIRNPGFNNRRGTYLARCIWGYLHDYYHHQGHRPFDQHIQIKTKWFTGLLEELKVDLQTYLTCIENRSVDAEMVAEFIVLDRMFRYPSESDWWRNFDSGTGILLLSYLYDCQLATVANDGSINLSMSEVPCAAKYFIKIVEQIEALENEEYLVEAEKLVRSFLPERSNGARIGLPEFFDNTKVNELVGSVKQGLIFSDQELLASREAQCH